MNKVVISAFTTLALASVSSAQVIKVGAAFAPNAFGSAQFAPWVGNAIDALMSGSSTAGTVGTSAYYQNVAGQTFNTKENVVTNFQSWRGQAPGIYSPEYGTRMHFPMSVVSTATFSLSQVGISMSSTDVGDVFQYDTDLSGTDFGSGSRVGIYYGADGVKGTGDDVLYNAANPGSDSVLINELYYRGLGNAEEVLDTSPGLTNQQKIDLDAAILGDYKLTTKYTVGNLGSSSASVNFINPVPEPTTMAALGLGALALLKRRKKS